MGKGKFTIAAIGLVAVLLLSGCGCKHEWGEATCELPSTCTLCGETTGEPLGHDWAEATCEQPEVCSACGATQKSALGHEWMDATCIDPQKCATCSRTEGDALGHTVENAKVVKAADCVETGEEEGVCTVCGETVKQTIPLIEHKMGKWNTLAKETCTEEGTKEQKCTVCGYAITEKIPATGHTEGDWVATTKATYNSAGVRTISCTVCKEELKTETYELTAEEKENDFKSKCKSIGYKELERNPGANKDKLIKVSGTVFQVCSEATSSLYYSMYFVKSNGNLYCVLIDNYGSGSRILEDDKITIYGTVGDLYTYETISGASKTIPKIYAEYYK